MRAGPTLLDLGDRFLCTHPGVGDVADTVGGGGRPGFEQFCGAAVFEGGVKVGAVQYSPGSGEAYRQQFRASVTSHPAGAQPRSWVIPVCLVA